MVNQVDNSIDQMGEQIGQGIDDAAKDITSGLKKTGEKTGNFWENWRDYLTPNNAEKFVSVALLFPLFITVVLWLLTRVSGWVYGQYFLPLYDFFFAIFQIAIFLVKALFLIGSGLGVAAAGYVLYKNESKRTVWGWLTGAATVLSFLGCLGINQSYPYNGLTQTFKILGWVAVVWGDRYLLQSPPAEIGN